MPTGYTSDIEKGITFQQFALNCARAFGALVTMRDEPHGASIPKEFKAHDYNAKALADAEKALASAQAMKPHAVEKAAEAEYKTALTDMNERIAKKNALRVKYEAMLTQARKWTPPSPDHDGLRDFMVQQITESIKFDCDTEYEFKYAPERLTGEQWREAAIAKAQRDIDYHQTEHAKEVDRTNGRNRWVRQLRDSLKEKP